jgi:glucan 1,3-beta-glucosidase
VVSLNFYGGASGLILGNQQFSMQNINIYNARASAIQQLWSWGWTYRGVNIYNCSVGLDMSAVTSGKQEVGSVTFIDSSITNTPIGVLTAHSSTSQPATGGSLILENVALSNVPIAIKGASGTILTQGHRYSPTGPVSIDANSSPFTGPANLIRNTKYCEHTKLLHETLPLTSFVSARKSGAKGDGKTDDTAA